MPEAVYPDRWRLELRGGIITDRPGLTVPGFSSGTVAQRPSVQKCGDTQGGHFKKMLLQMLRRRTWTVIAYSHSIYPYSTCGGFPTPELQSLRHNSMDLSFGWSGRTAPSKHTETHDGRISSNKANREVAMCVGRT